MSRKRWRLAIFKRSWTSWQRVDSFLGSWPKEQIRTKTASISTRSPSGHWIKMWWACIVRLWLTVKTRHQFAICQSTPRNCLFHAATNKDHSHLQTCSPLQRIQHSLKCVLDPALSNLVAPLLSNCLQISRSSSSVSLSLLLSNKKPAYQSQQISWTKPKNWWTQQQFPSNKR